MASEDIPEKLHRIAAQAGYYLLHSPTVYKRGWPQISKKPWGLYFKDGHHCASFGTLENLERNLRARAGC